MLNFYDYLHIYHVYLWPRKAYMGIVSIQPARAGGLGVMHLADDKKGQGSLS